MVFELSNVTVVGSEVNSSPPPVVVVGVSPASVVDSPDDISASSFSSSSIFSSSFLSSVSSFLSSRSFSNPFSSPPKESELSPNPLFSFATSSPALVNSPA